jgi:hypothetical protein
VVITATQYLIFKQNNKVIAYEKVTDMTPKQQAQLIYDAVMNGFEWEYSDSPPPEMHALNDGTSDKGGSPTVPLIEGTLKG